MLVPEFLSVDPGEPWSSMGDDADPGKTGMSLCLDDGGPDRPVPFPAPFPVPDPVGSCGGP